MRNKNLLRDEKWNHERRDSRRDTCQDQETPRRLAGLAGLGFRRFLKGEQDLQPLYQGSPQNENSSTKAAALVISGYLTWTGGKIEKLS